MKNKVLIIRRNDKPDAFVMFLQVICVGFYRFCDAFDTFADKYS